VPLADTTAVKAPAGIDDKYLVLMADIWPTGFFAAHNGFSSFKPEEISELTVVVIGCGPVGLCAVINAEEYKPKHLFAVDSVDSRLELAKGLGAETVNFVSQPGELEKRVKEVTEGRGADVVIEVVGLSPALKTGFDILRPWGVLSSVGVHNGEVRNRLFEYLLSTTDSMDWKPSLWQESSSSDGKVSCSHDFPTVT
jgi:threonine dehydrogenase-like Zn-dependent dehydrogenase